MDKTGETIKKIDATMHFISKVMSIESSGDQGHNCGWYNNLSKTLLNLARTKKLLKE